MLPFSAHAQITIVAPATGYSSDMYNDPTVHHGTSETYAETFKAPNATSTELDAFTLYLVAEPTAATFTAYVVQWDTSANVPTGAPLWTSDLQTTDTSAAGISKPFTFNTGGLALDPSTTYAMFAYSSQISGLDPAMQTRMSGGDTYATGQAYILFGPNSLAYTSQSMFTSFALSGFDMAFSATFSGDAGSGSSLTPVPEVGTPGVLIGAGFVAIAGFMEVRRRRATGVGAAPQNTAIAPAAGA